MPERPAGPGNVGGHFHDDRLDERQPDGFLVLAEPVQDPGEISSGQGWPSRGMWRCAASDLDALAFSCVDCPTIQSFPWIGRPATTAEGRSRRPMTAAQTTSIWSLCFTLTLSAPSGVH